MARPKVNLELSVPEYKRIAKYLEHHETDIANDINDFGELRELYVIVFDDNPEAE